MIRSYLLILFITILATDPALAREDTGLYAALLQAHVHNDRVDYQGFKRDEGKLDQYLASLAATDPATLQHNERFAFYINAYNAYTIKLILKNFHQGQPVSSIKDVGGFFTKPWSIKFVQIGGKTYTLDNIEHDILRPTFKAPRVHFAVNCASKSCPPLLDKPYLAATLDKQLTANAVAFINNRQFNRLAGDTLHVSAIFKWFREDFGEDLLAFFQKYAQDDLRQELARQQGKIKFSYLRYDWSLNDS